MSSLYKSAPSMPEWAQQLAGILPLTALIEFIDLPTKLHVFELAGCVPLWHWPVTPAGARILLSTLDNDHACCLDREDHSTVLHCIDGRYGDCYPSSTPTTTRVIMSSSGSTIAIPNNSLNLLNSSARKQKLSVIVLDRENLSQRDEPHHEWWAMSWSRFRRHSVRYRLLSFVGWLALGGTLAISLMCGLYLSIVYLILLPLTGIAINATHGGQRRRLLDEDRSEFKRVVVCTNSFNGTHWWLFYGGSHTLNSLLNKPLFRTTPARGRGLASRILQLLIACQWVVAIASCAFQDWNAIIISIWLAFCAISSGYFNPSPECVRDWLKRDCHISSTSITTEFSSRRSMLSAMVYLNPDSSERRTSWINPILAPCAERQEWEEALLNVLESGTEDSVGEDLRNKYWWKFITEGIEMGKAIERVITQQLRRSDTNQSNSSAWSESFDFLKMWYKV